MLSITTAYSRDVIECSKDDIKLNADGTFSLPLTGFAAGSHGEHYVHISVRRGNCRGAHKEVTATLYISATTKPSDVLGLTNGSVYNQISLPHTPKKSTTSYTGTTVEYPENGPAMKESALFLYATKGVYRFERLYGRSNRDYRRGNRLHCA